MTLTLNRRRVKCHVVYFILRIVFVREDLLL